MKEKYIKFFKKELIFLLLLLVVICFSFGLTYSNFVYSSDSYRAVEMFANKLNYEVNNKTISVKPGNNLVKINVKSLNNIDSYYKVVYDNIALNVKFFDNKTNKIKPNEKLDLYLLVYNKSNKNETTNIDILGGFVTNTYDDIKVEKGYYEVNDNIEIGDIVTVNNYVFNLLNIDEKGNYELISKVSEDSLNIEGSNGYNQYIDIINNNMNDIVGCVNKKAVSIEDIEKYTNNKIVDYGESHYYSNVYYPALWALEECSVIENNQQEEFYTRSEGVKNGNYEHAPSIIIKSTTIDNNIKFKDDRYKDLFLNSNYLIASRYQHAKDNTAVWGVLSMKDGKIKQNELFESNQQDYIVKGNVRFIITLSNEIDLFSKSL